jgi:proline iminopeptidase
MLTSIGDTELWVERTGRGQPLLVMHGGLGIDHTSLRPWLDGLGDGMEIIYYDHRGNGRSSRSVDWAKVSHATWAEDADELCEKLGLGRVAVLGHSYGAFLALEMALHCPERVAALVLVAGKASMDDMASAMARAQARLSPDDFRKLVAAFSRPVADDADYQRVWADILPVYFHHYHPPRAARMFERTRYSAAALNHAFAHCIPTYNVGPRLHEVRAPTLLVAGRHDWIAPPDRSELMAASLPDHELVVLEDSGHFCYAEQPQAFLAEVSGFLRRKLTPALLTP